VDDASTALVICDARSLYLVTKLTAPKTTFSLPLHRAQEMAEAFPHTEVIGFDLIRNSTLYVLYCSDVNGIHDRTSSALSHQTVGKDFCSSVLTTSFIPSSCSFVVGDMTKGGLSPYQSSCDLIHCRSVIGHVSACLHLLFPILNLCNSSLTGRRVRTPS
jgi:hypothetical protein